MSAFPEWPPLVSNTGLTITIPGGTRGKGRPRFGNGRTFTDQKTENAEAWIKACAIDQVGQPCLIGALSLRMVIDVEIPASWSKKKRAAALAGQVRPTGRPDIDNCVKLYCDALNKIVWCDDAQLTDLHVSRRYAEIPQTVLTVRAA